LGLSREKTGPPTVNLPEHLKAGLVNAGIEHISLARTNTVHLTWDSSQSLESKQITAHCEFAHYWEEILHVQWQVAALNAQADVLRLLQFPDLT
jgi:hypothetical protein